MTHTRRAGESPPPRDPLLEAAFEQFVQQAQAPPEFAARVRARVARAHPVTGFAGWPWLRGPAWARLALATGLVLSLALNGVWLGSFLLAPALRVAHRSILGSEDIPQAITPPTREAPLQESYGRVRLAFANEVREQELRTLLLDLRATIIDGPSPQGVYVVQVPLAEFPLLRWDAAKRRTADPMRLLLEELRAYPAVRLAEPASAP